MITTHLIMFFYGGALATGGGGNGGGEPEPEPEAPVRRQIFFEDTSRYYGYLG